MEAAIDSIKKVLIKGIEDNKGLDKDAILKIKEARKAYNNLHIQRDEREYVVGELVKMQVEKLRKNGGFNDNQIDEIKKAYEDTYNNNWGVIKNAKL